MPAFYEYRHVELDRVGCGKRKCASKLISNFWSCWLTYWILFRLGCSNLLVADRATFSERAPLITITSQSTPRNTTRISRLAMIWPRKWRAKLRRSTLTMALLPHRRRLPRTDHQTIPNQTPRVQVKTPNWFDFRITRIFLLFPPHPPQSQNLKLPQSLY